MVPSQVKENKPFKTCFEANCLISNPLMSEIVISISPGKLTSNLIVVSSEKGLGKTFIVVTPGN